jgi:hypothetical protein
MAATAFVLNLKEAKAFAPTKLKSDFDRITNGIDANAFFADSKWAKGSTQWRIKTSGKNVDKIQKNWGGGQVNPGKAYTVSTPGGFKIKFEISGKTSAGSSQPDAKTTRMQELGSAWIMRRAIKDNYRYKDWQSIRLDPKYSELVAIYPAVDDDPEWLQGYYAQQKKMLEEFAGVSFTEFNRDGGFMDYITDLVRDKFGIVKKDTWNPADIWLIKNESTVMTEIKKTVEGSKASQTVAELNAVLRKMFKERKVVGISLKKISGKVARYEEVNVSDDDLGVGYNYNLKESIIDLSFADNTFGTQDARVIVTGDGSEYNFQIKGNDSSKVSNLKFEPTAKGASSARIGKAPVDMVAALMRDNNMAFENNHNLYPATADEFLKKKQHFVTRFNFVNTKAETRVSTSNDFVQNIIYGYNIIPHTAKSKLMELDFLYHLYKLSESKRDEFLTDMVFIAAKKGSNFGPFGKLY